MRERESTTSPRRRLVLGLGIAVALALGVGLARLGSGCQPAIGGKTASGSVASSAPDGRDPATSAFPSRFPAPTRIVAIGDLHGDLNAARTALRLGRVMDEALHWSGGTAALVQTGDVLDRGDSEREILDLLDRLSDEARAAGGAVHLLNGNHELMNVAGDVRYVSPHGFQEFADVPGLDVSNPVLGPLPFEERARAAAFRPGGPYARKLAEHAVVIVVGDTLFVHGGLVPDFAREGIERINQEDRDWMLGQSAQGKELVDRRDSPVWVRTFGDGGAEDCALLTQALDLVGAARMVVGHTIQKHGISSGCSGRLWRIDVGMGSVVGATPQALEISGPNVLALGTAGPGE